MTDQKMCLIFIFMALWPLRVPTNWTKCFHYEENLEHQIKMMACFKKSEEQEHSLASLALILLSSLLLFSITKEVFQFVSRNPSSKKAISEDKHNLRTLFKLQPALPLLSSSRVVHFTSTAANRSICQQSFIRYEQVSKCQNTNWEVMNNNASSDHMLSRLFKSAFNLCCKLKRKCA